MIVLEVTHIRHGKLSHALAKEPSLALSTLLILIEKEKERLGKQERRRRKGRRRGAMAQAKGSTDIHGNLQTHSVAIISINAERQQRGKGWGHGGVREGFFLGKGC